MELSEHFQPVTPLRVRLQTDLGAIEVEGQVVWTTEAGEAGRGVLHGVAFTHVPSDQLRALRDLIASKGQVREAGVRLPLKLSVTCRVKGQRGLSLHGWTGDVTRGGVSLSWYGNVSRGKRRKVQGEATTAIVESSEICPSEAMRAWARLITQVYEVDPLVCPQCAGAMRILACIEQPAVIDLPVPSTADREDPDSPRVVDHPSSQPARSGAPAAGHRSGIRSPHRTRGRPRGLAPPWGSGSPPLVCPFP